MIAALKGAIAGLVFCMGMAACAQGVEVPMRFINDCETQLEPGSVKVEADPSQISYNFNRSVYALTQVAHPSGPEHAVTLGLTEADIQFQSHWQGAMLQDSITGLFCVRPQIRVTLSASPMTVSVGREFSKDDPATSCSFWEIVNHELRHVAASQKELESTGDDLRAALTASFGNRVFYGTQEDLKEALTDNLRAEWMPWAKVRFHRVDDIQAAIDSPEEYGRMNTMCDGEVPRTLGQR